MRTFDADVVFAEAVSVYECEEKCEVVISTLHGQPRLSESGERRESNAQEFRQHHVALECLGDGARTLVL